MRLQKCLDDGSVPEWMVKGRTVLIQKDPSKGTAVGNYRPIACLPMMWKLLTGVFAEKVYDHLLSQMIYYRMSKKAAGRSLEVRRTSS